MSFEKKTLNLLYYENLSIEKQLLLEEMLLRSDKRNWCLINKGSPDAIVMGISGKPYKLLDIPKVIDANIPIIKRFTGGGTVVVDNNTLFITFICHASDFPFPPFPGNVMQWSGRFYKKAFWEIPFQLKENDYVIKNHKFGGNAQYFCKERWLHHTSFIWDYSLEKMSYLLLPEKFPQYRKKRSHSDFICCLKDFLPSMEYAINAITASLRKNFHVIPCHHNHVEELDKGKHRKSTRKLEKNDLLKGPYAGITYQPVNTGGFAS